MRHLGQIRHDRLAGDVLAQRQRQRRARLDEQIGRDDLPQGDHLTLQVGNLDPHRRLAGNDLHHPHGLHRKGPGQILGQIADLGNLHPRCGQNLEAGDHRTRLHRLHRRLDPEIGQIALKQFGHLRKLRLTVARLGPLRRIQQFRRRQRPLPARLDRPHLGGRLHHCGFCWRISRIFGGGLLFRLLLQLFTQSAHGYDRPFLRLLLRPAPDNLRCRLRCTAPVLPLVKQQPRALCALPEQASSLLGDLQPGTTGEQ